GGKVMLIGGGCVSVCASSPCFVHCYHRRSPSGLGGRHRSGRLHDGRDLAGGEGVPQSSPQSSRTQLGFACSVVQSNFWLTYDTKSTSYCAPYWLQKSTKS